MTTKLNLIFDLDGTLIDSSAGVIESVNYALEMTGNKPQPDERIIRYIGSPLKGMFTDFCETPFATLLDHFRDKADDAVVREAVPLRGVNETLAKLHSEGYRMGIATTKARNQTDMILDRLNWKDYFRAVSGGDEVKQVKPAPDIFELSLKRMEIEARGTIVIGDTINDVLGARGAGLKIIAVPSDCGDPEALTNSKPDYQITCMSELPQFLVNLGQNWKPAE